MNHNILKYGLLAFFALVFTLPALAQDGPGGGGTDEEDIDPTPIDNWILLLVLAGITVGVYFLMNRRKATA